MTDVTMHCPHACKEPCPTCEVSATAQELRALRLVAAAARALADGMDDLRARPALWWALDEALKVLPIRSGATKEGT